MATLLSLAPVRQMHGTDVTAVHAVCELNWHSSSCDVHSCRALIHVHMSLASQAALCSEAHPVAPLGPQALLWNWQDMSVTQLWTDDDLAAQYDEQSLFHVGMVVALHASYTIKSVGHWAPPEGKTRIDRDLNRYAPGPHEAEHGDMGLNADTTQSMPRGLQEPKLAVTANGSQ
jgi:hypothetical protein